MPVHFLVSIEGQWDAGATAIRFWYSLLVFAFGIRFWYSLLALIRKTIHNGNFLLLRLYPVNHIIHYLIG